MIYTYLCHRCESTHESERSMDDRYLVECPKCGAPAHQQEIQLHPVRGTMIHQPQIISEAQVAADRGADWRETPGSRRMAADEPEKLYSCPGDVTRRKGKKVQR
jgi:putative FmdB family regulatory protein